MEVIPISLGNTEPSTRFLDQPCNNVIELKKAVLNRKFTVEVAEDLHERVAEAVRLKAIAKQKLQEIAD